MELPQVYVYQIVSDEIGDLGINIWLIPVYSYLNKILSQSWNEHLIDAEPT